MYSIPSYVHYTESGSDVLLTSDLRLNTVKLTEPDIVAEFYSLIKGGGCSSLSTPLTQFLHQQQLLLSSDEIQSNIQELYEMINKILFLTIMPTEACNFRCPYCYEDHAPITMSPKTLQAIHQYIYKQAPNFRHIQINWFGGEPTLCKEAILETSQVIHFLQEHYQFEYSSSMTTNGYLLGLDDFKDYYQAGIRNYQITLDGWNHDTTRPHVTGKGTLNSILDNLLAISSLSPEEYNFQITLRHNILSGDEDYDWYDYLKKLFGKDHRFSVSVRPVNNWGGDTVQSLKLATAQEANLLVEKHRAYLNSIGMNGEGNRNLLLSNLCYASYPHGYVVRANGQIEKCTICLNHPLNVVGHVIPGEGFHIDQKKNALWASSQLKENCYHCKHILSCLNSACPKARIIDGLDIDGCSTYTH